MIGKYEDIEEQPRSLLAEVHRFLGVEPRPMDADDLGIVNAADLGHADPAVLSSLRQRYAAPNERLYQLLQDESLGARVTGRLDSMTTTVVSAVTGELWRGPADRSSMGHRCRDFAFPLTGPGRAVANSNTSLRPFSPDISQVTDHSLGGARSPRYRFGHSPALLRLRALMPSRCAPSSSILGLETR